MAATDDEMLAAQMHVPENPPRGGDHPLYVFDRTIRQRLDGSISGRLYGGLTLEEINFRASDPVGFHHKHGRGGPLSWEDQREAQRQEYLPPSLRRMSFPHTPARRSQLKKSAELAIRMNKGDLMGYPPFELDAFVPHSESEPDDRYPELVPEQVQYEEEYQDIMGHRLSMKGRGNRRNRPLRRALFHTLKATEGEGTWRYDPANPYRRVEGEKDIEMDPSLKMKRLLELYEKSQDKRPIPPDHLLVS